VSDKKKSEKTDKDQDTAKEENKVVTVGPYPPEDYPENWPSERDGNSKWRYRR